MASRCFYIDESYNADRFCLTAISIKDSLWRDCFARVKAFRKELRANYGIPQSKEIHAHKLIGGRGNISSRQIGKHERSRIFHRILRCVAGLPQVKIFNVCLEVSGRRDPQLDAWDRLLNRIERTLVHNEDREHMFIRVASKALDPGVQKRLLHYHPRAILFVDEGRQTELTRAFRKMHVFNPIPSRYGHWNGSQTKNIPLERVIEDPVFKKSEQSFFIQFADCVSFALLKREVAPTPNILRYGVHLMFDECVAGACVKEACRKDPLGIVRK